MNQRAQDLDLAVPAPPTRNQIEADESARPVVSGRDIAEGDTRAVHVRRVHCRARNSRARGPHRRRRRRAADPVPAGLPLVARAVVDGHARGGVCVESHVGRRATAGCPGPPPSRFSSPPSPPGSSTRGKPRSSARPPPPGSTPSRSTCSRRRSTSGGARPRGWASPIRWEHPRDFALRARPVTFQARRA